MAELKGSSTEQNLYEEVFELFENELPERGRGLVGQLVGSVLRKGSADLSCI